MSSIKYANITLDLFDRIRDGELRGKLPVSRELTRRYNVSLQTVNTALKPLIRLGLLNPAGRHGTIICPEAGKGKLVGVVGWFSPENTHGLTLYEKMLAQIEHDGFSHVLLSAPGRYITARQSRLFSEFDAVLFTDTTFRAKIAEFLDSSGIPFAADGLYPTYPDLNFVEFDTLKMVQELTLRLKEAGYSKIGLCFPSPRDGFNELIQRFWRQLKKKHGLPLLSADYIRYDWQGATEENTMYYLRKLNRAGEEPHALIIMSNFNAALQNKIFSEFGDITRRTLLIGRRNGMYDGVFSDKVLSFELPDFSGFYLHAWRILKMRLLMPELPPIQEWISYPLITEKEIPVFSTATGKGQR